MVLESVKVSNFKSIGTMNNVLYVEDAITALIGKNESGKSNVLEAIGRMKPLTLPLNATYVKMLTRGQDEQPKVSLVFHFSPKEKDMFSIEVDRTILSYDSKEIVIEGGLSSLISHDEELNENINFLLSAITTNLFSLNASQNSSLKTQVERLKKVAVSLNKNIFNDLTGAKTTIKSSAFDKKDDYIVLIDAIQSRLEEYYNLLPQIFYRTNDEMLKDTYTFDEIKKLMTTENIFHSLMIAADVDLETLTKAFQNVTEAAKKTYKEQIILKINNLLKRFGDFYGQESISLDFDIESQSVKLYVRTMDKYMSFSERSNGLKWYFSLFVDLQAKTNSNRPILFLLDEPGVYLHVKAQKQLLELFGDLCKKGNQVIYTTHSPFMIDASNVFNVRAIEKDTYGLTNIYRSIYNHKLNQASKLETLSPLIEAFGMDLKDNIGPQYEKTNIVVEGVTDSMYIIAMMNNLNIAEELRPNIIPCAGVDNVNLVVSILIGWGCEYKVVVDYDGQGYKQYKLLTQKSRLTDDGNVFFVNCKTAESELDVKGDKGATTETLIAEEDNDKLLNKYDGTNNTKTLAAKEFMDRVSGGNLVLTEVTRDNFRKLFVALGIIQQ